MSQSPWLLAVEALSVSLLFIGALTGALTWFATVRSKRVPLSTLTGTTLEDEKSRREIEDLRFGWIRTLATALFAVAIAVGGWVAQAQSALDDQKQRAGIARDDQRQRDRQHEAETFFAYLDNLGDSNATKRIDAADYLGSWYRMLPASDADKVTISDAKAQIVLALVNRIAVEDDLAVLDELRLRVAYDIGQDAFQDVVEANRRSSYLYASGLGQVFGNRIVAQIGKDESARTVMIDRLDGRAELGDPRVLELLSRLTAYTSYAFAVAGGRGRPESARSFFDDPDNDLSSVYRRNVRDKLVTNELPTSREMSVEEERLRKAAAAVASTGSILAVLLKQAAPWSSPDLRGTIIPFTDLSALKLRGANLSHAIILAKLDHAQLQLCDLGHTNLSKAQWDELDVTGSNLESTLFDQLSSSPKRHLRTSGSNSWKAGRLDFDDPSIAHPFPGATARSMAQRFDECKREAARYQLSCRWTRDVMPATKAAKAGHAARTR